MREAQEIVLAYLREHGPKTALELGDALWNTSAHYQKVLKETGVEPSDNWKRKWAWQKLRGLWSRHLIRTVNGERLREGGIRWEVVSAETTVSTEENNE